MNPIRIAVAGLGEAGHDLHLPALSTLPDIEVVGLADPSEHMRSRAADRSAAPVFGDVGEMLAATTPDVVIVATPPHTHLELGRMALEAGAHLVMEKPFVSSLADADELISAAKTAGRGIALNHEFREMPILSSVRRAIQNGAHGDLVFMQLWQLMDMPSSGEGGWRGALHHRTLFEAGVHLLDYAMAVFDEKPVSVTTNLSQGGSEAAAPDSIVTATLEFSGGRLASLVQTRLSKGARQYFEVRADTTEASFRASFGGRARLTAGLHRSTRPRARIEFGVSGMAWRERGDERHFLARNPKLPRVDATRRVLADALAAFRAGEPPPIDAVWGREVLEVIVACYLSAETGRRVRLDSDDLDRLRARALGEPGPLGQEAASSA